MSEGRPAAAPGDRVVRVEQIAGDASTRRYFREWRTDGTSVVRCRYPATDRAVMARDAHVLSWIARRELRVPELYEVNVDRREIVLEDFGPEDAEATLRATEPEGRWSLTGRLLEPLVRLAVLPRSGLPGGCPRLDEGRLRWELAGFELWFMVDLLGRRPCRETDRWLDRLARAVASHPLRVCHRDFHLNNVFFLPDGSVGIIDVQDLLLGPDGYDAVSMAGERAFPELLDSDEIDRWLQLWAASTGARPGWRDRVAEARLQRGLKVLGTFARLARCGRRGYLRWTRRLAGALVHSSRDLEAPRMLRDLLLHWEAYGGGDVR